MLEVKPPPSLRGWEAIVFKDSKMRGVVLSDEWSDHLQASVLTIDWTDEPPEIVMVDHGEMIEIDNGYILIQSAGRGLGFIPVPLIHSCGHACTFHPEGRLSEG